MPTPVPGRPDDGDTEPASTAGVFTVNTPPDWVIWVGPNRAAATLRPPPAATSGIATFTESGVKEPATNACALAPKRTTVLESKIGPVGARVSVTTCPGSAGFGAMVGVNAAGSTTTCLVRTTPPAGEPVPVTVIVTSPVSRAESMPPAAVIGPRSVSPDAHAAAGTPATGAPTASRYSYV